MNLNLIHTWEAKEVSTATEEARDDDPNLADIVSSMLHNSEYDAKYLHSLSNKIFAHNVTAATLSDVQTLLYLATN